jgi:hypothetical protein
MTFVIIQRRGTSSAAICARPRRQPASPPSLRDARQSSHADARLDLRRSRCASMRSSNFEESPR